MRYVSLGEVPRKRHVQVRRDGRLLVEEVMGYEGFSGNETILYHLQSPCRIADVGAFQRLDRDEWVPDAHVHRLTDTAELAPWGDPVTGRRVLQYNDDVELSICLPECEAEGFHRNGEGDEVVFVHEGSGTLETVFGELPFGPHDYVVIPRGTTYRFRLDAGAQRWLCFHTPGEIETPKRYRNRYGQLLEHAPYSQRDFRPPAQLRTFDEAGRYDLTVRVRGGIQAYVLDYHPFDVVGWDGYVYPYAFNVADFEPKSGRLHQPPPAHQTFEGPNFVICSFCPRRLDWDPEAVPVPYHHSNLQSEEVMYYVDGSFSSRKGVGAGAFTLHPSGLPHGPQPGVAEASLGAEWTDELVVMCDTFRPLKLTALARELDRPEYAFSWNPDRQERLSARPRVGAMEAFDWHDGERRVHFGRGRVAEAVELLGGPGYVLLSTERARAMAPQLAEAAQVVLDVPPGRVDEIAAGLLDAANGERIVALGGGRVVDTAKAVAAALRLQDPSARPMAVPTTLSGAEMTWVHRHAAGVPADTPRGRPAVVINDPALSASQPEPELAASALNALGHAAEAPLTKLANPVATLTALEAARRIAAAFAGAKPDRDSLALGALLAGAAIDSSWYGLHHVLSQTLVRLAGVGHGPANAVMLPHSLGALAWRFADANWRLGETLGEDPATFAARLCARTGATTLSALGVARDALERCADAAAERDELDLTPPRAARAELLTLYEQAL